MKVFLKLLAVLCAMTGAYVLYSLCNPVIGTIIFGSESIVFTPRRFADIGSLDYNVSNKGWYWVGQSDKLISLLENDPEAYSRSEKGGLEVELRYINLFFSSAASYVQRANIPIVYVWSVKRLSQTPSGGSVTGAAADN